MSGRNSKLAIAGAAIAAVALIQVVPYGRTHTNPPVTGAPAWDSPRTEELARRACFDCHSNETQWPWWSRVAPVSWRIQTHVLQGRRKLNFSEADRPQEEAGEAAESVRKGAMPPGDYAFMHPRARLDAIERQELIRGLAATFGEKEHGAGEGKVGLTRGAGEREGRPGRGHDAGSEEPDKAKDEDRGGERD